MSCLSRRDALGLLAAPALRAKTVQRPNFVFILIDDLRFDALGSTGPYAKTPNIDRIAAGGVNFRNAFVTTPLCSPSRASYLTGRYVHAHRVSGNGDNAALSHQLVTFPRLLQGAGYDTAYIGKWHMGTDDTPRPGFDRWVSFKGQGVYKNPPLNIDGRQVKGEGYMTDLLSDHAAEFVRRQRPKPFCLTLAHKAVHGPFEPADRHLNLYNDVALPKPPNLQGDRTRHEQIARNQLRCLAAIDEGVGRLLQAIDETGQTENTVVVFTSDNGYFWGEHGYGDKRWAYEESIRIPLLVRYPKLVKPARDAGQMALNIDIAPTILDLAGVKPPPGTHGESLVPILNGKARKWRRSILTEYFKEERFPATPTWQSVRTERWKLVNYPDQSARDELFDLRADRFETRNLIAEDSAKKTVVELRGELQRLLRSTS